MHTSYNRKTNTAFDATAKHYSDILSELRKEISDPKFPLSSEKTNLLIAEINKIESTVKSSYDSNQIQKQLLALNLQLMDYRREYAESKKKELIKNVNDLLNKDFPELKLIEEQTSQLTSTAIQFKKQSVKKSSAFSSLFKCFQCCTDNKDEKNETATEHNRLLTIK